MLLGKGEAALAPGQNAMSMTADVSSPDYVPDFTALPPVRFDVSDTCSKYCACTRTTMVMTDNFAMLKSKNCCGGTKQKKPYANLMITAHMVQPPFCPCPVSFSSDFNRPNKNGEKQAQMDPTYDPDDPENGLPITPGCGCSNSLVESVVTELNDRREKRGNMAQMLRLEYMSQKVFRLATQIPVLLNGLGGKHDFVTPPKPDPPVRFETKSFDVSQGCEKLFCASQTLTLKPDMVEWEISSCCGWHTFLKEREYSHLGEVEMMKSCFICRAVDSDLGPPIQPGFGCQKGKVMEIVQEMRHRLGARGSIGQIKRIENMFQQVAELDKEVPKILQKNGAQYPPTQETMKSFGHDKVNFDSLKKEGVAAYMATLTPLKNRTFDVTNKPESCVQCCFSCGIIGCTKTTVELQENHMNVKEVNNIDDTNAFVPYAQMDSVEIQKSCCCCFQVNEYSPGLGCFNGAIVQELGAELQIRKVRRAEIAQLKYLETMQSTCLDLNCQMDAALKKANIPYPPDAARLQEVYGQRVPAYVNRLQEGPLKLEPPASFENKVYDITNYWEFCANIECGGMRRTLTLEHNELKLEMSNFCVQKTSRTPYANVDSMESEENCCCFHELPDLANPGFGCSKGKVQDIAEAVTDRFLKRGDTAQLKMMENVTYELLKLDLKTDLLMKANKIAYPPAQDVMSSVFKEHAQVLKEHISGSRQFVAPPPIPPRKKRARGKKGGTKDTE